MKTIVSKLPVDLLVEEYQQHLLHNAGLKPNTGKGWAFYVRRFLNAQFKPKAQMLDLRSLTPQVFLNYLLEQSHHYAAYRLQLLASALRSFGRFLSLNGRGSANLGLGLPRIGGQSQSGPPTHLTAEQLDQLLTSFDRQTACGQRDYALVLCLARLGLRAAEVAQLTLEAIDWEQGVLHLEQTKGRRERQLPLPQDVGRAIVKYLQQGRPPTISRSLFVTWPDGQPLLATAVSRLTSAAMQRVGITTARKGAHLLRRTVASHLVQKGASLKEVADLLGHRHLSTTQAYAQVNWPQLLQVAKPWPQEGIA